MSIDGPYETELKLAAHDAQVLEAVADLRTLAGYALRPHPEHQIRDQYWDTPQGVLSARRLSLRLRSQDGAPIFTVKRAATVDDGLFRRRETELSASRQTWAQIRAELAAEGARLRDAPAQ